MKNKYLRLFVAQTKLMTAEKMRLDRFCQRGEYLAYKIALPPDPDFDLEYAVDVKFIFAVDLEDRQYHFTDANISEDLFSTFELHLSAYLNELFRRKVEFERDSEMFKSVMQKLVTELTEEEQRCLATNIDANTLNVLRALGVASV
jgi:hypothetical protein